MTAWKAILLGIVQGLGTFFPISASGHFVLIRNTLRIGTQEDLLLEALLQLAALAAAVVGFLPELRGLFAEGLQMIHAVPQMRRSKENELRRRLLLLVLIASIPLIADAFLRRAAGKLTEHPFLVGFALLCSGGLLFLAERRGHGNKNERAATAADAILIGLVQALAIVPGLSRTAATVAAGRLRGFDRSFALKFSFLISVPALLGVHILTLIDAFGAGVEWPRLPMYLLGMAAAFISGYAALYLFRMIVQRGRIGVFSYYCWGAGLLTLLLSLIS